MWRGQRNHNTRGLRFNLRSKNFYIVSLILLSLVGLVLWQYPKQPAQVSLAPIEPVLASHSHEPIQPIPRYLALDPQKVKLGEQLFHDSRLSHDNTIACASCHQLKTGGTDRRVHSIGINGTVGFVNAPTVFNSGFNFKQFWDGRAETLEAQIDGPTHTNHEMGSSWPEIIAKLRQSSQYASSFSQIYPEGITSDTIKDAIATFERSLYTPNSRFDQFLRGDSDALSAAEKAGYQRFKVYGCISCHQGMQLGGNMFQTFGVMGNYLSDRGHITPADLGRFRVTQAEPDRYVFKVPGLRNVTLTAPYFHDGSAATLDAAVKVMAKYQLGRQIPQTDVDLIIKFFQTLTGEYQGRPL
ncbi:MAG: cytochrome-c peroxidase [Cyanothece sp. SIO1E1]|nr:cytochrome-c peroxidase [Cyanothece sp. SIO1E1]